ncbi:MAG: antitoxin VapB family protein [Nanoarchaeota archaeon]
MAKTIMVSNAVYDELTRRKGDMSYSELIIGLMERKTGSNLRRFLGAIPDDKGWGEARRLAKKGWDRWNKRYA